MNEKLLVTVTALKGTTFGDSKYVHGRISGMMAGICRTYHKPNESFANVKCDAGYRFRALATPEEYELVKERVTVWYGNSVFIDAEPVD